MDQCSKWFSRDLILTKEDRGNLQLYDEFERFKMLRVEYINVYYVQVSTRLVNDMRNYRMTLSAINIQTQTSSLSSNMSPEWDRFVIAVKLNKGSERDKSWNIVLENCTQPKRPQDSNYFKDKMLLMQAQENGAELDEEELLFLADECDAFDSDVDDEPTAQSIFMANLSSAGSSNEIHSEVQQSLLFDSINGDMVLINHVVTGKFRAMKAVFENMEAEVDQNAILFDMHDALTIAQNRIADLESKNFNLRNKIQNDDHDSMIKHFSKLEVKHFNLQLKYQNLKERFGNKKPVTSSDAPSFDSLFMIRKLNEQIQSRGNTIRELKEKISRLTRQ
ncbi:hypothetical protein Tco_0600075 [Tanacetum coccineum]|uniref:Uncharacterized protein n=1 Tax=Tanacetum coccineum TaxID=301880 RepID=A0ABQ4WAT2_9ASTR